MRKKSHISLAKFIVEQTGQKALRRHRKAFYIGSVLPDCRPSFLTERHEFYATFGKIADGIRELAKDGEEKTPETAARWRRFGEILHYVADYFTYPHNLIYEGTLRQHCAYEKELRDLLKEYIASGRAAYMQIGSPAFEDADALLDFICTSHSEYVKERTHSAQEDVRCIVCLCRQVAEGLMQLMNGGCRALNAAA